MTKKKEIKIQDNNNQIDDDKFNQYLYEQIMKRPQYTKERKLRASLVTDSSHNDSIVKLKYQFDDNRKIGGKSKIKAGTQAGTRKNIDY